MFKKRRIRGGFVSKHFAIFATTQGADSQGHTKYAMSFNYRDNFADEIPLMMSGRISEVEEWNPASHVLPRSGGGILITPVPCSLRWN